MPFFGRLGGPPDGTRSEAVGCRTGQSASPALGPLASCGKGLPSVCFEETEAFVPTVLWEWDWEATRFDDMFCYCQAACSCNMPRTSPRSMRLLTIFAINASCSVTLAVFTFRAIAEMRDVPGIPDCSSSGKHPRNERSTVRVVLFALNGLVFIQMGPSGSVSG
ncbi:hypothetical protein M427DRAFT_383116 [Gonapodya prolifera JEL478]|uniref:Uncharacterized protein n=1 Tax=Gonapodya prolifera (strain JEL478) TaxID=1344416 RepID=A0A139A8T8_GONPJ|nr:hypothetical protein M427DRAFT_383116 [Gonapodya prolifera JEL478]|eukprot:KXS13137.1 hypothetical protein M427DRAFT_383116 [Gonapodya prolifera JEL478]